MVSILLSYLCLLGSIFAVTNGQLGGLAPRKYLPLPLGDVRPSGWLMDQIQLQIDGLAGHEHEFYNYISQTTWLGGDSLYSNLEEAGSYWFNGMVPTGILANSSVINDKTYAFLDYVLGHQDATGWLGPEVGTDKPRFLWGRYPFMFGAIQMIEARPELTDRVVTALHKFVTLANSMIKQGQGVEEWGSARYHDFVITLQWLYENHPNGNEDLFLETMQLLKNTGVPWENVFLEEFFPTTATDNIVNPLGIDLAWHGVNIAESLKSFAAVYRFTHNQTYLEAGRKAWDILFQYHGRPSGVFAADEFLAGLDAIRGSELCLVVEMMFSGSYLFQVIGDLKFADRIERVAYNALPATLTGNMWSRQYLQQQNQIAAKNMNPNPFPRDGPYSNVFGLEPNYPCCTVNHPQGWSKFISNAFLTSSDKKSLIHVYLGPFQAETTLDPDNHVSVKVDTLYPFSDIIVATIIAAKEFTYFVRIPNWVVGGSVAVNGGQASNLSPSSDGLQAIPISAGTTKITLHLPAEVTTENRPHDSIAIHRGPLHYAFDIPRTEKVLSRNAQQPMAVDLEFDSREAWQYAIDPLTLQFHATTPASGQLPNPVFDSGGPPLSISVTACPVEWAIAGDTFAASPPNRPPCIGANTTMTLTPYGSTKLRIGEFPVMGTN